MSGSIKVAACQTPDIREDLDAALHWIENCAAQAAPGGVNLLCFPECFLQGYLLEETVARRHALDLCSPEFAAVLERLSDITPTLVIGLIEVSEGRLHNTAVSIGRGRLIGAYRKTHLLAAERLFQPGHAYPVSEAEGFRFGINICYDTNFTEAAIAVARQGARAILCPANNMLPYTAAELWKDRHNEVRRQRAMETGLWLISADVTGQRDGCIGLGPTAIIDPEGRIVGQVPLHKTGMVAAEISW